MPLPTPVPLTDPLPPFWWAQRTTLNKSRTIMIYQFSLVLSPEQNTALKAYFERNRRDRR